MRSDGHNLFKVKDYVIAACLAALVLIMGSFLMVPGVCGTCNGDGVYVSTAKALAEGRGYLLINLPGAPPQTKYPIIYPAVLAVIWKIFPDLQLRIIAMQMLSLLCAGGTVAVAYLYLQRFGYASRLVSLAAALLVSTSPPFLFLATQTLSDIPYALVLLVVLWIMERRLETKNASTQPAVHPQKNVWKKRAQLICLGILLAIPSMVRVIGAAMVPPAFWLLRRRGHSLVWPAVGWCAAVMPWVIWVVTHHANANPVIGYYTDYTGWWQGLGWKRFLPIVGENMFTILCCTPLLCMQGLGNWLQQHTNVGLLLFALTGPLTWLWLLLSLRNGLRLLPLIMIAQLAVIIVWPWSSFRFLVPISMPIAAYMASAVFYVCSRFAPPRLARLITTVLLVIAVSMNLIMLARLHSVIARTGYPTCNLPNQPSSWAAWQRVTRWLKQNAHNTDVVAAELDSIIYLYSGIPAYNPFAPRVGSYYGACKSDIGSIEDLEAILQRTHTRYLVAAPSADEQTSSNLIRLLQQRQSGNVKEVYKDTDPRFVIFELQPSWRTR